MGRNAEKQPAATGDKSEYLSLISLQPNVQHILGASIPRAGHHLLAWCLQNYFGDRLGYCAYYVEEKCCRKFPCENHQGREFIYIKNHDFDFVLPKNLPAKYVIQVRGILPVLISNFELSLKVDKGEDTWDHFVRASKFWTGYYKRFLEKWVMESCMEDRSIVVVYENLVSDFEKQMYEIVKFIEPTEEVDSNKIKLIFDNERIFLKRKVEDFKHFNEEYFRQIETDLSPYLQAANIPTHF